MIPLPRHVPELEVQAAVAAIDLLDLLKVSHWLSVRSHPIVLDSSFDPHGYSPAEILRVGADLDLLQGHVAKRDIPDGADSLGKSLDLGTIARLWARD